MAGTLYVVATPIGNLEDLTPRAARVLAEADLIAAENTRTAAKLLRRGGARTPCLPYNDRNKGRSSGRILRALADGAAVALISDAGTPGISDPGQDLVAAAVAAGATVVPVPGASAVTALLSVAGVRARSARLLGFLPRKQGERRRRLQEIAAAGEPAVVFESPHRLRASLADIAAVLPQAQLVMGRELTKRHEEIWRGSAAEALRHFRQPRGEFAIVVAPPTPVAPRWSNAEVRAALREARAAGQSRRDAAKAIAAPAGWPRRELYALWPESDEPGLR